MRAQMQATKAGGVGNVMRAHGQDRNVVVD